MEVDQPTAAIKQEAQGAGAEGAASAETGSATAVEQPFWAAADPHERNTFCPTCTFPLKFDFAAVNIEIGSWCES